MNRDQLLEELIASRNADVVRFNERASKAGAVHAEVFWRDESRRAAADVARLVALRSPEAVKAMEMDRGLV